MGFSKGFDDISKKSILFVEGEEWKDQKRLIHPAFQFTHIKNQIPKFNMIANRFVSQLGAIDGPVEVDSFFLFSPFFFPLLSPLPPPLLSPLFLPLPLSFFLSPSLLLFPSSSPSTFPFPFSFLTRLSPPFPLPPLSLPSPSPR